MLAEYDRSRAFLLEKLEVRKDLKHIEDRLYQEEAYMRKTHEEQRLSKQTKEQLRLKKESLALSRKNAREKAKELVSKREE